MLYAQPCRENIARIPELLKKPSGQLVAEELNTILWYFAQPTRADMKAQKNEEHATKVLRSLVKSESNESRDLVLNVIKGNPGKGRSFLMAELDKIGMPLTDNQWHYSIRSLMLKGKIRREGSKINSVYYIKEADKTVAGAVVADIRTARAKRSA